MTAVLDCDNVTVRFGGVVALSELSLTVSPGEVLGVFGPNGAGKTTLFNAITGHAPLSQGQIRLGGQSISRLAPHRIFRMGLARTFQIPELIESQSVETNVLLGAHFSKHGSLRDAFSFGKDAKSAAENALATFGLADIRLKPTSLTTLYERKLIMLASAVAARPKVLLLDEPAGGLTDFEIDTLIEHIRRVSETGITILLIEHVMPVIMALSTRIMVLSQGRLVVDDVPSKVRQDARVRSLYFGEQVS